MVQTKLPFGTARAAYKCQMSCLWVLEGMPFVAGYLFCKLLSDCCFAGRGRALGRQGQLRLPTVALHTACMLWSATPATCWEATTLVMSGIQHMFVVAVAPATAQLLQLVLAEL